MFSLLLAIIYIAFISLGLPDSLLGAAWPIMQMDLGVPTSWQGIITIIISLGTVISSLMSDRLIRRFNTGLILAVSVSATMIALFGFSFSTKFWMLCLWSVPYGLGAGAVDSSLNNYVALHYSSRHMSFLHAFWGVGVTISPIIMGVALTNGFGFRSGYRTIAYFQLALSIILFLALPLWKKKDRLENEPIQTNVLSIPKALRIPGVIEVLFTFFAYCSLEASCGSWASTYLVNYKQIEPETAAFFASCFFFGETGGRFLSGFIADKVGDRNMVRYGIVTVILGIILILIPVNSAFPPLLGLVVLGLGAAPIYPCLIHSTPSAFGKENSQSLVGLQMASAYLGTTLMPPLFGLIAQYIHVSLYPVYLALFAFCMLFMSESLRKKTKCH